MILNSINCSNLSKINFLSNQKTKAISFTQNPDRFEKGLISQFEFTPEVSKEAKQQIIEQIREIEQFPPQPLGIGATGVAYQLRNIDGFGYNGIVVKISHTEERNEATNEKQKPNCDFKDEIEKLKKAKPLGSKSQQYLGKLKLSNGKNILITTYIEGKTPDIYTNPLNKKSLNSLTNLLYRLDSAGVLHRDLKQENLLIDAYDNAKLIDFGEAVDFNLFDADTNSDSLNFISFEMPTNFQNFEDTFLTPYYEKLKEQNPQKADEFYRDYLHSKACNVYARRMSELDNFLVENIDKINSADAEHLLEMSNYQKTMAFVLGTRKLSDEIVNIELMRNQVTYLSELAYKNEILLANPLANVSLKTNALISAKKLEAMALKELKKPNSQEVNRYLKYQIEIAKYRQEKIAGWLNGLVGWICTCLTTDIDTQDSSKKKLIDECVNNPDIENFTIPNIVNK